MAVYSYFDGNLFIGLDTDPKPITDIPDRAVFLERNKALWYWFDKASLTWTLGASGSGGGGDIPDVPYVETNGTFIESGDNVTKDFTIPHTLSTTPTGYTIEAGNEDTILPYWLSVDATFLYVHFTYPPKTGVNNVIINWRTSFSGIAGGAITDVDNAGVGGISVVDSQTGTVIYLRSVVGLGPVAVSLDAVNKEIEINVIDATELAKGVVQLSPDGGTTAGRVVQATDGRLSNARTPTPHASTHGGVGSDPLHIDTIGSGTDNATNNATTTKHGLLPKLSGIATQFLNGNGVFSTPSSGGGTPYWSFLGGCNMGFRDSVPTVFEDIKAMQINTTAVPIEGSQSLTIDVDFGASGVFNQYKIVVEYTKDDSGTGDTHDIRIIDNSNASNFDDLLNVNNGRTIKTGTLLAWMTGEKILRVQHKANTTGNTPTLHKVQVFARKV